MPLVRIDVVELEATEHLEQRHAPARSKTA